MYFIPYYTSRSLHPYTTPHQPCVLTVYTHYTLVFVFCFVFLYSDRPFSPTGYRPRPSTSPCQPSFRLCQAIFKRNLSRTHNETFPTTVILHTYPPMKMEQCSETSSYEFQTPVNYLAGSTQ